MQSGTIMRQDWHLSALNHILLRHNIHLDSRRSKQLLFVYNAINQLGTTSYDHLEILRLFELALVHRQHFQIKRRKLSTVDLFYASVIVGLKLNNETHSWSIFVSEVLSRLPRESVYYEELAYSKTLEKTLLEGLNWRIQESLQQNSMAYIKLLEPLHPQALSQFATSHLITANTGAGDHQLLHEVLCALDPTFDKKATLVMQGIKALPLLYCFIDHEHCRKRIKRDIFNFLQTPTANFTLTPDTFQSIRATIAEDFTTAPRPIFESEYKPLHFYFSPDEIKELPLRNIKNRLTAIKKKTLLPTYENFDVLISKLRKFDLTWVNTILLGLEKLSEQKVLTSAILIVVFKSHFNTQSILNIYLTLHNEGWLRIINRDKQLPTQVSNLISKHHHSPECLQVIQAALESHFTARTIGLNDLIHLKNQAKSSLGESLAFRLIIKQLAIHFYDQAKQLRLSKSRLTILKGQLLSYAQNNKDESFALVYALETIDPHINELHHSLYLAIMTPPEDLRFKIRLFILLKRIFSAYHLTEIPRQKPSIYEHIFKNIESSSKLKVEIQAFFSGNATSCNDNVYRLDSIEGVKRSIRTVIDTAIAHGDIQLTDDEKEELAEFYESYKIAADNPINKTLPPCHLFSPKHNGGNNAEQYKNMHRCLYRYRL